MDTTLGGAILGVGGAVIGAGISYVGARVQIRSEERRQMEQQRHEKELASERDLRRVLDESLEATAQAFRDLLTIRDLNGDEDEYSVRECLKAVNSFGEAEDHIAACASKLRSRVDENDDRPIYLTACHLMLKGALESVVDQDSEAEVAFALEGVENAVTIFERSARPGGGQVET